MGYRGRLTALTLTFSSSMIWAIYSQFMYGPYMEQKGRLIAVLLSLVLYGSLSWFLGGMYDKARYYAYKDQLTGLYNRRFVEQNFQRIWNRAAKQHQWLGVILIEAEGLKELNRMFGYRTGDQALLKLADQLLSSVDDEAVVSRWGSSSFLLITPTVSSTCIPKLISELTEAINSQMSRPPFALIKMTYGYALSPDHGQRLEELVHAANSNMSMQKYKNTQLPSAEPGPGQFDV